MRPVIFRVDATEATGMGHLMRCIPLAEAVIAAGGEPHFVMTPHPMTDAVVRRGYTLHAATPSATAPSDADQTARLARDVGASIVVVDGYGFDGDYLEHVGAMGSVVCYVDDLAKGPFPCRAVLNHNLAAASLSYDVDPNRTTLLLGHEYALIREEFVTAREQRDLALPDRARKLLVTMGGSDPTRQTPKVLQAILRCDTAFDVRVLVGPGQARTELPDTTHHRIELLHDVKEVAREMLWCDLAIVAAGVTTFELACVGVPAIAFAVVDNQLLVTRGLVESGLMRVPPATDQETLSREIDALAASITTRQEMVKAQRGIVDGLGKHRVIARLRALAKAK